MASPIHRDLTDDCYLEYNPEWTTDVFRWDGGEYIEVGNIDADAEYTFRMVRKIGIPWHYEAFELSPREVLKRFKGWCIDWHQRKQK